MNTQDDDEQWLDELSGRTTPPEGHEMSRLEAGVVRRTILKTMSTEAETFSPTEEGFRSIVVQARRRGLMRSARTRWHPLRILETVYLILSRPAGVSALAALVVSLALLVPWQALGPAVTNEGELLRGGVAEQIELRVADPKVVASQWQRDLLGAGVEHTTSVDQRGRVMIRFVLTPAAIEILRQKRVPPPSGAVLTLVIIPVSATP